MEARQLLTVVLDHLGIKATRPGVGSLRDAAGGAYLAATSSYQRPWQS